MLNYSILPALGDGLSHYETIFVPEYLDSSDDNQTHEEHLQTFDSGLDSTWHERTVTVLKECGEEVLRESLVLGLSE